MPFGLACYFLAIFTAEKRKVPKSTLFSAKSKLQNEGADAEGNGDVKSLMDKINCRGSNVHLPLPHPGNALDFDLLL